MHALSCDDVGWGLLASLLPPEVECWPLAEILDTHAPGQAVDFLDVDIESQEYRTLQPFPFAKHSIRITQGLARIVGLPSTPEPRHRVGPRRVLNPQATCWTVLVFFFPLKSGIHPFQFEPDVSLRVVPSPVGNTSHSEVCSLHCSVQRRVHSLPGHPLAASRWRSSRDEWETKKHVCRAGLVPNPTLPSSLWPTTSTSPR